MKNIFLIIALFISGFFYTQITSNDLEIIQSKFGKAKKELVIDYMELNQTEGISFWPIYDAYEKERQALVSTYISNIWKHADKYDTMTDNAAAKVMSLSLDSENKYVKLKKKYYSKMRKAVGGITAAKFFQLENYLYNSVLTQIQEQLPNIGDLQ